MIAVCGRLATDLGRLVWAECGNAEAHSSDDIVLVTAGNVVHDRNQNLRHGPTVGQSRACSLCQLDQGVIADRREGGLLPREFDEFLFVGHDRHRRGSFTSGATGAC